MITVELFLKDLSEAGIKKLKDAGVFNPNWDTFPITILVFEAEDEELGLEVDND
jgi:hypothetical protein